MAQQEARELLTGLAERTDGGQACAHQIAHRFVCRIGNPYRRQVTRPMQRRQLGGVPPVGLDPLSRLAWDQRGGDHNAVMPQRRKLALDPVAARARLVTQPKRRPRSRQFAKQSFDRFGPVRDLTIVSHLTAIAPRRKRNRDRLLVHVQSDIRDKLFHDPSPMHEARRRIIRRNPRYLHTVRRVAPISGEHVV